MKIRARSQLTGKGMAMTKGQTTAHVRIGIGGGAIMKWRSVARSYRWMMM